MRAVAALLLVIATLPFCIGLALAGTRVALVVGNGDYRTLGTLANPKNDAEDIASTLRGMGFTVLTGEDSDERGFAQLLSDFATEADGADIALFYYSGHGIQFESQNYLVPVDAQLENRFALTHETISLDDVMGATATARTRLVFIDACRSFPIAGTFLAANNERVTPVRGLAPAQQAPDTFIGFSASAGETAADGTGRNSPFTAAMLEFLPQPGIELASLFSDVTGRVVAATDGKQRPQSFSGLTAEVTLVAPKTIDPSEEGRAFSEAKALGTVGAYKAFLGRYPGGFYSELSREYLAKLEQSVDQCDVLASDPWDKQAVSPAVMAKDVAKKLALSACAAAVGRDSSNARFMFEYGRTLSLNKRDDEAKTQYKLASDKGYFVATLQLAGDAIFPTKPPPPTDADFANALAVANEGRARGYGAATFILGYLAINGLGRMPDVGEGESLYEEAAAEGNSAAKFYLGLEYYTGKHLSLDYAKALDWFKQANVAGETGSNVGLAILANDGLGEPKDPAKAAGYLLEWGKETADDVPTPDSVFTPSTDTVRALQQQLSAMGFYKGGLDGKLGKATEDAFAAASRASSG